MRRTHMTVLEWLDRMPPRVCRLVARDGRAMRGLTNRQVAERSGLTVLRVMHLSVLHTWKDVPIGEIDAFRRGCGITPANERRVRAYVVAQAKNLRLFPHLRDGLGRRLKGKLMAVGQ